LFFIITVLPLTFLSILVVAAIFHLRGWKSPIHYGIRMHSLYSPDCGWTSRIFGPLLRIRSTGLRISLPCTRYIGLYPVLAASWTFFYWWQNFRKEPGCICSASTLIPHGGPGSIEYTSISAFKDWPIEVEKCVTSCKLLRYLSLEMSSDITALMLLSMEFFLLRTIQLLLLKGMMRYTFRTHVTERFVHGEWYTHYWIWTNILNGMYGYLCMRYFS
jgi:hypothetical protein